MKPLLLQGSVAVIDPKGESAAALAGRLPIPMPHLGVHEDARPAPAPAPKDEASLSARALAGDIDAWNALVMKHNHRVVVSLLGRGVRMDRAKDLAQETWIRLIEQQREGRLKALQLPGLAVTQASFLALEAARREGGVRRTQSLDGGEDAPARDVVDPAADAESRLLTEERIAAAEEILAQCSPSAKKVFRLVYGTPPMSHADVAQVVGLSLQRVRQIVCEVRKQLRAAVQGSET